MGKAEYEIAHELQDLVAANGEAEPARERIFRDQHLAS
jgi:hypothetical protein